MEPEHGLVTSLAAPRTAWTRSVAAVLPRRAPRGQRERQLNA